MTGNSSARPDKSGKNRISSAKSKVFAEVEILATKHEILKENYENLVKDFQCLEDCFKNGNEMNEWMKWHLQNQTKELEANSQRLIKDLEKERREKEECKKEMERLESAKDAMINYLKVKNQELLIAKVKKEVEYKKEMGKMESEKEALINYLRITNQELVIAKEKEDEELKKMKNAYGELTQRYGEAETEISYLRFNSQCLIMNLEQERSEKEEYKKEMERMESVKEAVINNFRIKNRELLIAKEKGEEELKKMKNKYGVLSKRYGEAEKECSYLKSRYKAKNLDVAVKNDVTVGDDQNVNIKSEVGVMDDRNVNNNTSTDPIVISDESDAEEDNTPPVTSNILPQWPHWSVKRPRKDYN